MLINAENRNVRSVLNSAGISAKLTLKKHLREGKKTDCRRRLAEKFEQIAGEKRWLKRTQSTRWLHPVEWTLILCCRCSSSRSWGSLCWPKVRFQSCRRGREENQRETSSDELTREERKMWRIVLFKCHPKESKGASARLLLDFITHWTSSSRTKTFFLLLLDRLCRRRRELFQLISPVILIHVIAQLRSKRWTN